MCGMIDLFPIFPPDIDECLNASVCNVDASCQNTVGSFMCICNSGFSGNGSFCSSKK